MYFVHQINNYNNNPRSYRDFIINSFINLSHFLSPSLYWIFIWLFLFFSLCRVTIKTYVWRLVYCMEYCWLYSKYKVWNILAIVLPHAPAFALWFFSMESKIMCVRMEWRKKRSRKKLKSHTQYCKSEKTSERTRTHTFEMCTRSLKNIIRFNCWWQIFFLFSFICAMLYSTRDLVIVYLIHVCCLYTMYAQCKPAPAL